MLAMSSGMAMSTVNALLSPLNASMRVDEASPELQRPTVFS
jgi:hypothetical protein